MVEFNFLKAQAQEPLATFMEYITYEYMIENIMMLLKGTLSGRDVNELIEQCHPMVRETPGALDHQVRQADVYEIPPRLADIEYERSD